MDNSGHLALLFWSFVSSVFIALPIILFADLIPSWGEWYSPEVQIRQQSDALLSGTIALETDPGFVEFNYLWDNGKVQQVWGLGVAAWRLPFEAVSAMFGRAGFPDRIAFGLGLLALAALAIRILMVPDSSKGLGSVGAHIKKYPESAVTVLVLVLYPPFGSLMFGWFSAYEEVQAYSYLAGVGLLMGTVSFWRNPGWTKFFVLAFLAGAVPIVRPTLGAYGVVSFCIMAIRAGSLERGRRGLLIGALCFLAGGSAVIASNAQRFGSGFEFGHSLNLNPDSSMRYVSRFENPFRQEPIGSAAAELGSWLFFMSPEKYRSRYERRVAPLSPEIETDGTFRYRRLNAFTYDLTYVVPIAGIAVWSVIVYSLRTRRRGGDGDSGAAVMGCWCVLSVIPLFFFYLWFPVLYARYLLDFAPAFAAGFAAFLFCCRNLGLSGTRLALRWIVIAVTLFWWGWQMNTVMQGERVSRYAPITYAVMKERIERPAPDYREMPEYYETGMEFREHVNQYNGSGWNSVFGTTGAAIALFVEVPEFMELTVAPVSGVELSPEDYEIIRVKVGLEFLELESMTPTEEGIVLRFAGPRRKRYQSGIQVVFVAFMTAEELHSRNSRFRLLRVEWKEEGKGMNDER